MRIFFHFGNTILSYFLFRGLNIQFFLFSCSSHFLPSSSSSSGLKSSFKAIIELYFLLVDFRSKLNFRKYAIDMAEKLHVCHVFPPKTKIFNIEQKFKNINQALSDSLLSVVIKQLPWITLFHDWAFLCSSGLLKYSLAQIFCFRLQSWVGIVGLELGEVEEKGSENRAQGKINCFAIVEMLL